MTSTSPLHSYIKSIQNVAIFGCYVGLGAIVQNLMGEIMLTFEAYQDIVGLVELKETLALFNSVTTTTEVCLHPFWAEMDSQILWKLLTS